MAAPDPDFWQEAAKWLAGLIVLPLGYVWRKVNNSVQKEDFKDFCQRFDQHCRDDRETQAKLFDKIDDLKTTIIERMK
jgi:hypothetical protein